MSRFPSLPDNPHLSDVFKRFPRGAWTLLKYHDELLRGDSEFTAGERELMAAYVSGLNACGFCHGSHRVIAEVHGIEPAVFEKLLIDPEQAGLEAKWVPLLAYLRKLTQAPSRVSDGDAQAVYAAGWSEDALFDAVAVCATFNMMNRIVEGCGVQTSEESRAAARERQEKFRDSATPYRDFGTMMGFEPEE